MDTARYCFDIPHTRDRARGAVFGAAAGAALAASGEGRPPGLDAVVLGMRTLAAHFRGETGDPARDLAARLLAAAGFPELGEAGAPRAPDAVTAAAAAQPDFATAPAEAARRVVGPSAENGALPRAVACAFTTAPGDRNPRLSTASPAAAMPRRPM